MRKTDCDSMALRDGGGYYKSPELNVYGIAVENGFALSFLYEIPDFEDGFEF